jgi:hypothetical protein
MNMGVESWFGVVLLGVGWVWAEEEEGTSSHEHHAVRLARSTHILLNKGWDH